MVSMVRYNMGHLHPDPQEHPVGVKQQTIFLQEMISLYYNQICQERKLVRESLFGKIQGDG